jgi:hypothetical protein
MQAVVDTLAESEPKAVKTDAKKFIDDRFLKKLEEEGFVKKLFGPVRMYFDTGIPMRRGRLPLHLSTASCLSPSWLLQYRLRLIGKISPGYRRAFCL